MTLTGLFLLTGCQTASPPLENDAAEAAFTYDATEIPGAKPWSSENFANDPNNFQFAIIGDRAGGGQPKGYLHKGYGSAQLVTA